MAARDGDGKGAHRCVAALRCCNAPCVVRQSPCEPMQTIISHDVAVMHAFVRPMHPFRHRSKARLTKEATNFRCRRCKQLHFSSSTMHSFLRLLLTSRRPSDWMLTSQSAYCIPSLVLSSRCSQRFLRAPVSARLTRSSRTRRSPALCERSAYPWRHLKRMRSLPRLWMKDGEFAGPMHCTRINFVAPK